MLRLATWNIEWMNALFDDKGALMLDDGPSARYGVTRRQQAEAIADVFRIVDPDGILVVEGPDVSRKRNGRQALEDFAVWAGLRCRSALLGFANDTQQELLFLYDPDALSVRHDPQATDHAPRFDGALSMDLDVDAAPDPVVFSKPPLEMALEAAGHRLRLIGCHVKSKAPHGARNADEARAISIANRRKQLAQCIWLRRRVEDHLQQGDPLIVLGDLNDGPGLDAYEALFGRSGVEIVLGEDAPPEQRLFDPHARLALGRRLAATPVTARFFNRDTGGYLSALLDYIMLSPDLMRAFRPAWRIWHPFDDPACYGDPAVCHALLTASDHFPVSVDLNISGELG